MTILSLENVSLGYGDTDIIKKVDFSFSAGEKIAIIGRSGCGKTTLLHYLHTRLAEQAALCSQSRGLVDNLSLYHNIYMGALARHHWSYNLLNLFWPQTKQKQQVSELCKELELDLDLHQSVFELSGGQRQRVALARALYQRANILLADEPFTGLDPKMTLRLLKRIFAKFDTLVMILHDKDIAVTEFDRVVGLANGAKIFDLPAAQVTEAMLASCYQTETQGLADTHSQHLTNPDYADCPW